ncbi:MAG TPA: hypothetical protein V6C95_23550 [Coleofasciculaceae cyanobacterium]
MARQITTSAKTIGYYCTIPPHIEEILGSHFENIERTELFSLLATLANYMAYHSYGDSSQDEIEFTIIDAYNQCPGELVADVLEILPDLELLPNESIVGLAHALIAHIGG